MRITACNINTNIACDSYNNMRHYLIYVELIMVIILYSSSSFGFGTGDWQQTTPEGNIMGDPGSGTSLTLVKTRKELSEIRTWYFYKRYIIGNTAKYFFIANEMNGDVLLFKNRSDWDSFIHDNALKPVVWTRWYSDNWVDRDNLFALFIFFFFISIPLLLLFLFAFYKAIKDEHLKITKPYTVFVLLTILVMGGIILLDIFPQSI